MEWPSPLAHGIAFWGFGINLKYFLTISKRKDLLYHIDDNNKSQPSLTSPSLSNTTTFSLFLFFSPTLVSLLSLSHTLFSRALSFSLSLSIRLVDIFFCTFGIATFACCPSSSSFFFSRSHFRLCCTHVVVLFSLQWWNSSVTHTYTRTHTFTYTASCTSMHIWTPKNNNIYWTISFSIHVDLNCILSLFFLFFFLFSFFLSATAFFASQNFSDAFHSRSFVNFAPPNKLVGRCLCTSVWLCAQCVCPDVFSVCVCGCFLYCSYRYGSGSCEQSSHTSLLVLVLLLLLLCACVFSERTQLF